MRKIKINKNKISLLFTLIEKEEYSKALLIAKLELEKNAKNIELLRIISICYIQLNQFSDALNSLYKIKSMKNNLVDINFLLAICTFNTEKYNETVLLLNESIKDKFVTPDVYQLLGKAYFKLENFEKSIYSFFEALKWGENFEILNEIAETYSKLMNYDKALEFYFKSKKLNPENVESNFGISEIYIEQKKYDEAIEHLIRCIKEIPSYINFYIAIGIAYEEILKYDEALSFYYKALEIFPENSLLFMRISLNFEMQTLYKNALEYCIKSLSVNPKDPNIIKHKGHLHYVLEEYEESIEVFSNALILSPNEFTIYNDRANSYFHLKEYEKALKDFDEVIKLNIGTNDARIFLNKGICLFYLKKYDEAIECYKKDLKEYPDDYDTHMSIGVCYALLNDYDLALASFNRCLELKKDDYRLYFNLAITHSSFNRNLEAIENYSKSISFNNKFSNSYLYRGICYFKENNSILALEDLTTFKELFTQSQGALQSIDDSFIDKMEEIWTESDIEFMGKLIVSLFELNESTLGDKYISLCKLLNQLNGESILHISKDLEQLVSDVFQYYPDFNGSINYHFNAEGRDLFIINSKLCLLEHMILELMKLSDDIFKNPTIIKLFFLINKYLRKGNLEKVRKHEADKLNSIKEINSKLEKMVQQYTHTLSNTLFPNTIFSVYEKISKLPDLYNESIKLKNAYNAELQVKKQGQLLQIRYSGDSAFFQQYIRSDRLELNTEQNSIAIKNILNNSIEYVLNRFLNIDYHKLSENRSKILKLKETNLDKLKKSFEENVILNQKLNSFEWTNKYFLKITLEETDLWRKIRMKKDNYSEALLQGYFSELLFNSLKYADYYNEEWVKIELGEEKLKSRDFLYCKWKNSYDRKKYVFSGKKGLEGIENDLNMLNNLNNRIVLEGNENFEIKLLFSADLFIPNKQLNYDINKLLT